MQLIDGQPVFSATDLVGYLECEHLAALERAALEGLVVRPHLIDPELDVLRRRGEQHEQRYLADLEAAGRLVVRITRDASAQDHGAQLRAAAVETVEAMAAGADVIYQATFFDGRWRGHADFLLRRDDDERPSAWGGYHYEVADTKLARHVKAGAVLQVCVYTDLLTMVQGVAPEWFSIVLGGSTGGERRLRVADFMAYYRAARRRFDDAVGPAAGPAAYPPLTTYPEPVDHCEVCRWRVVCADRRHADDHLSLVAGISRRQRRALVDRGVGTLAQLAVLPLPMEPRLEGTSPAALARVREQARIQLAGREAGTHRYELLLPPRAEPLPPDFGLSALPRPSRGDLFFDIEGDPYTADDGLEYLFGVMDADGAWFAEWSRNERGEFGADGEKRAFEAVMDRFMSRLREHPDAHIYHFAPYEPSALKRLMGRHATREADVDRLLRGDVLIDLHRIVRQSLRASVESYSIKKIEPLYGFTRTEDLRDAGSSIAAFEEWLQLGDGERPGADHLDRIERYNRDDVMSNRLLRDWLEDRRAELAELAGQDVPRPGPKDREPSPELGAREAEVAALAARLTDGIPEEGRTDEQQARWLLAQLLSWHRREDKSFFWNYFHLKDDLTDAERVEDSEPLAGLVHVGAVRREDRSVVRAYAFPPQEYDVKVGMTVHDPATGRQPGTVVAIDEVRRIVELKRGRQVDRAPHPTALIPYEYVPTIVIRDALLRLGCWVADHGLGADGPRRAALDLLLRRPPRVGPPPGARLRGDAETDLDAARRLAMVVDRTTLPIQGPPGSGKTYAGARMALDLVRAGRKVGVTANSHKVISKFLAELCEAAEQAGASVSIIQKAKDPDGCPHRFVTQARENDSVAAALTGGAQVVAGTVWLWARDDMTDSVDVLFVDEAGQLSLANTLAAAQAARSIVLLGDPQQLDQPLQGAHPPGADRSALGHFLGDAATLSDTHGLFMETTWRLHPHICAFTSAAFYEGRLLPKDELGRQRLNGPPPAGGTGLRLLPVHHRGNDNESIEEAEVVARLVEALVDAGATWTNRDGEVATLGWNEIVIVAAYNAQVGAIRSRLPQARVGTVDKFQGQEAPLAIYSMASSSVEDAPRGVPFLYSRHRLNVATSRARCVSVVVASPELLRAKARTPEHMRLANALAQFAEFADRPTAP